MEGRRVQIGAAAGAVLVALGLGVASPPVLAQCRLCSTPRTTAPSQSEQPLRLELETRLDFNRLVVIGSGGGSAMLHPNGERAVAGSVGALSGSAMVGAVTVRGEPGRALRVDLPKRIELFSLSGRRIALDGVTTDLPAMPRLDSAGTLQFRFGGKLELSGDVDGEYRGDLAITVDYL